MLFIFSSIFGFYSLYYIYYNRNNIIKNAKMSYIIVNTSIKYFYILLQQYMNNTVKKIGKNTYELTYIINGNTYKMIVKPIRGPKPILQITDHESNDITDDILPYLGPNYNWHGEKFSLDFFNKKEITFELIDGTTKTYNINKHTHIEELN
jgi:hypothetical protein